MEIFSLILHGVAFIAIIYLYLRLRHNSGSDRDTNKRIREIEDLFNSYLLELKDENRKLLDEMSRFERKPTAEKQTQSSNNEPQPKNGSSVATLSPNNNAQYAQRYYTQMNSSNLETEDSFNISEIVEHQEDKVEINQKQQTDDNTPKQKVLQMYDQNYSIETIAKYLNMGYTEVELIVKFHYKMSP